MTSRDSQSQIPGTGWPSARVDVTPSEITVFDHFRQVLDHPTFRKMAPGKSILYLQLLRWSHGNGKELVEASRLEMCAWTGLALETIKKYLPQLVRDGLIKPARESTPINAAAYEVLWMAPPSPTLSHTDPLAISYYIDQLNAKELAECARIAVLLTREERRQIQSTVSESLRTLGIPWNYDLIKKLIKWYHLTHSPYRDQLERDHPDWFTAP